MVPWAWNLFTSVSFQFFQSKLLYPFTVKQRSKIVIYALLPLFVTFCNGVVAEEADPELVYELSSFDKLRITVYGEPDLSTEQLISDSGEVSIPLLGSVKVSGLPVPQAAKLIERLYVEKEFLRNPVVTISLEQFASKSVSILGEVENVGSIEIPPGRTGLPIEIAIAGAGGFSGSAKTTEVIVTRLSPGSGESNKVVVNVDEILQSKGRSGDDEGFILRPGDVVFVPRRVF